MKRQIAAVVILWSLVLAAHPRTVFARAGDLDTTFGTEGGVVDSIGAGPATVRALVLQADGRLVAAGDASNGANEDFALVRYNADGSPDGTFNAGSAVLTPIGPGADIARALVVQSDGKLVAAGETDNGVERDFALVRYNTDGTLDPTFGVGGKVTTAFDTGDDAVNAVVVQSDGKLVAAGFATIGGLQAFALARYNANGSLDTTFGGDGLVSTEIGASAATATALLLQADGKLVAAGEVSVSSKDHNFVLVRYNADGSLDATFGSGGTVTTTFGGSRDGANAVILQPDGKLVAAGVATSAGEVFGVVRYNADGTLDTTFGSGGKVVLKLGTLANQVNALALQPDGKILAAGSTSAGLSNIAVFRLRTDGKVDKPTFGGSGAVATGIPDLSSSANALVLQPDGKFVAAGMTEGTGIDSLFFLVRYLGDPPYTPPDANALKCWTTAATNLDKLNKCLSDCQIKAVKQPASFDQVACQTTCRATYDASATKLLNKGVCPACLGAAGQSVLADKTTAALNATADPLYCAGSVPLAHPFLEEFAVTPGSGLAGITVGPDNNVWFTEQSSGKIGQITPAGTITEFDVPTAAGEPTGITAGPDSNLWFTEQAGNKIGRITPAGVITEFSGLTAASAPTAIAPGSDGNLWFTEPGSNKIGQVRMAFLGAPNFLFNQFSLPTASSSPQSIVGGPDGNLWFTEKSAGKIGRATVLASFTEFALPVPGSEPDTIASGPDGNLWFTEFAGNRIGRMTTSGSLTEFAVPTAGGGPRGITAGADGNLWFVEQQTSFIGRLTPGGEFNEYVLPDSASMPRAITAALDGSLWFTEPGTDMLGRIRLVGGGFEPPDAATLTCETSVAKNLATLAKCVTKCQLKKVKANSKGQSFDLEACEHTDLQKSCAAKFNSAANKLLLAGGCPVCLDAVDQAAQRDQLIENLNNGQVELFCDDSP